MQAREVVRCGLKGFINKCERIRKAGKGFYRRAKQTLSTRVREKLMKKHLGLKERNQMKSRDHSGKSHRDTHQAWCTGRLISKESQMEEEAR